MEIILEEKKYNQSFVIYEFPYESWIVRDEYVAYINNRPVEIYFELGTSTLLDESKELLDDIFGTGSYEIKKNYDGIPIIKIKAPS